MNIDDFEIGTQYIIKLKEQQREGNMKTKKHCKYYEEKNFDVSSAANAEGYFNSPENPCVRNDWYLKVEDRDICKTCKYKTGDDYIIDDTEAQIVTMKSSGYGYSYGYLKTDDTGITLSFPKYTAKIEIGDLTIQLQNKTFTDEQIKNMREMLGWEVTNL